MSHLVPIIETDLTSVDSTITAALATGTRDNYLTINPDLNSSSSSILLSPDCIPIIERPNSTRPISNSFGLTFVEDTNINYSSFHTNSYSSTSSSNPVRSMNFNTPSHRCNIAVKRQYSFYGIQSKSIEYIYIHSPMSLLPTGIDTCGQNYSKKQQSRKPRIGTSISTTPSSLFETALKLIFGYQSNTSRGNNLES